MDRDKGSPVLGADVLELIVDELYDDIPALTACALASSILLPRARRHLFRGVEIDNDLATRLLDLLDANEQLEHALESVHLVGEFDLTASRDPFTRSWNWMSNPDRRRLLSRLPRLQTLVLARFQWAEVRSQELSPSLFPHLRCISFLSCRLPANAAFVSFLSALPLLREVCLRHCTWNSDDNTQGTSRRLATIHLTVFELVDSGQAIDHSWMAAIGTHESRRLAFTLCSEQDIAIWQPLLNAAGGTLRDVELFISAEYSNGLWPDLGRLAQLRLLTIRSEADPWPRGTHPDSRAAWLLSALRSLHSAPLETVTLYMDSPQPEFFHAMDWSVLRHAMCSAGFCTPRVMILVKLDEWCMQVPDLLKEIVADLEECERLLAQARDKFDLGPWLLTERVQWPTVVGVGAWGDGIRRPSRRAFN